MSRRGEISKYSHRYPRTSLFEPQISEKGVSLDTGGHMQVGLADIAGLWEAWLAANKVILLGLAVEQGPPNPVRRQAGVQTKKRPGLACCIVDTVAGRFMFMLGAEAWSDKWRM